MVIGAVASRSSVCRTRSWRRDYAASDPGVETLSGSVVRDGRRDEDELSLRRRISQLAAGRRCVDVLALARGENEGGAEALSPRSRRASTVRQIDATVRAASRSDVSDGRRGFARGRRRRRAQALELVGERREPPGSPVACARAQESSRSASHGVAGQERAVKVRPDRAADATAFEARRAVVPVARDDAAERPRRRGRAPSGRRGSRSPRSCVREPPPRSCSRGGRRRSCRVSPARVSCGKRPAPGEPGAVAPAVAAPEQLVAAADREQRGAAPRRRRGSRRRARRGRARSSPARGPGRRRRRGGRARRARAAPARASRRRRASSWPRAAARRVRTAMLPRSA